MPTLQEMSPASRELIPVPKGPHSDQKSAKAVITSGILPGLTALNGVVQMEATIWGLLWFLDYSGVRNKH